MRPRRREAVRIGAIGRALRGDVRPGQHPHRLGEAEPILRARRSASWNAPGSGSSRSRSTSTQRLRMSASPFEPDRRACTSSVEGSAVERDVLRKSSSASEPGRRAPATDRAVHQRAGRPAGPMARACEHDAACSGSGTSPWTARQGIRRSSSKGRILSCRGQPKRPLPSQRRRHRTSRLFFLYALNPSIIGTWLPKPRALSLTACLSWRSRFASMLIQLLSR